MPSLLRRRYGPHGARSYPLRQARPCPARRRGARALGGFASAARVQTEIAGTEGHQLEQPAHDGDVFQKVKQLVLIGDIAMKNERGRNREDRQNAAKDAYLPSENEQQAAAKLNDDGREISDFRHRQTRRFDPGNGSGRRDNLAKAAHEKHHGHQTTPDKRQRICVLRHGLPRYGQSRSSSPRPRHTLLFAERCAQIPKNADLTEQDRRCGVAAEGFHLSVDRSPSWSISVHGSERQFMRVLFVSKEFESR
jgi:hypothetical protein